MEQINKLYCAQSHLYERLSEIIDHPNFADLRHAMQETIEDMEGQVKNTNDLYACFNSKHSFEMCNTMLQLLEEDFNVVQENCNNTRLRDISMVSYLQNIQNIINAAFQMIQLRVKGLDETIVNIISRNFMQLRFGQSFKLLLINKIQIA